MDDLMIPESLWVEMQAVDLQDRSLEPNDIYVPGDVRVDVLSANLKRLFTVWRRAVSEAHKIRRELEILQVKRDAILLRSRGKNGELPGPEEARYQALEP